MKRSIGGGAHRGPVAHSRQRRTIRLMQGLLVLVAVGLLMLAGYSWGRASGYDAGKRAEQVGAPKEPGIGATVVLGAFGLGALAGAFILGGPEGVRIPSPARLEELAGRAEGAAVDRAERAAKDSEDPGSSRESEDATAAPGGS
jgi:hypothetical protein